MIRKILKAIKKFLQNDIVERCYFTFFQSFLGVIALASFSDFMKTDTLKTLIVSATIAGFSALWNTIKTLINNKIDKMKTKNSLKG